LEQAAILRLADRAFAAIYRCLRYCGARPGELAGAMISQWDRSAGYLVLGQHKTARKTGKPRTIGVSAKIARIMDRSVGDRQVGPLFLTRRGRPWSAGTLSHAFRRLRDKAGLSKDLVLYSVRHGVGTAICERFGIHAAAAVLGHATWKTTERYAHIGRHKLAEYQAIL
jgi:integrase